MFAEKVNVAFYARDKQECENRLFFNGLAVWTKRILQTGRHGANINKSKWGG